MASYTMSIEDIVDDYTVGYPFSNTSEKIEFARTKIFDFDYPIFDELYRKVFETNFIRRFYKREIGFETDGLFKFQLETWLLIHMPYFNKLYESEQIKFDPLINSKVDVTHNQLNERKKQEEKDALQNISVNEQGNSITNDSSNSTGKTDSVGSIDKTTADTQNVVAEGTKIDDNFERELSTDTPDARLGITVSDGQGVIEYASKIKEETENNKENTTNITDVESSGTEGVDSTDTTNTTASATQKTEGDTTKDTTGETTQKDSLASTINDVEDFVEHRVGKIGIQTYSEMLIKYRNSFIRIEQKMFKEMNELFMLVY